MLQHFTICYNSMHTNTQQDFQLCCVCYNTCSTTVLVLLQYLTTIQCIPRPSSTCSTTVLQVLQHFKLHITIQCTPTPREQHFQLCCYNNFYFNVQLTVIQYNEHINTQPALVAQFVLQEVLQISHTIQYNSMRWKCSS